MSSEEKHTHYFANSIGWNLCCKQATYLLLKKEELKKLSFKEETAMKFHMAICKFCRAFKKQSAIMNRMISETVLASETTMNEPEKNKLKLLINSNLNKN
jgi:hypothetical protein